MKRFVKASLAALVVLSLSFSNAKTQTKTGVKDTTHTNNAPYSKVEVEASFPGGAAAWTAYITQQIMQNANGFTKRDYGTCIVKFIVDKNGNISAVEATNMQKTRLAIVKCLNHNLIIVLKFPLIVYMDRFIKDHQPALKYS